MNKKGQVLVVFILILPLILLFMLYLYDIGNLYYQKNKLKSSLKDSLTYLLNNDTLESEKQALNLVEKNIKDVSVKITKINNQTKIEGVININTNLLKKTKIKVIMVGKIDENQIKIWEE